MSAPARRLPEPEPSPARQPERRAAPLARQPAARPRISTPPHAQRRARRGFHPAFLVFSSIVVTFLVVSAVSLSALLVQTSFGIESLEQRIGVLADHSEVLVTEVAEASSPARVAGWARRRGMVIPEEVVTLTVPARAEGGG